MLAVVPRLDSLARSCSESRRRTTIIDDARDVSSELLLSRFSQASERLARSVQIADLVPFERVRLATSCRFPEISYPVVTVVFMLPQ